MLKEIILKNRSYRRFYQDVSISEEALASWVDLARLSASAANRQPLKYVFSNQPAANAAIFQTLAWAGYLPDWPGPVESERPSAYIVILGDKSISTAWGCDHGIAAQSIMLGAVEAGFGGCMIGSIDRQRLSELLGLSEQYEILLVLALGKPKEDVLVEQVTDNNVKYWRDAQQVHHVPKRNLADLIIKML